jgi:RNase P/RNase MRP subunit POP5
MYFSIRGQSGIGNEKILEAIKDSIQILFGITGLSEINPRLIRYDEKGSRGILLTNHLEVKRLRSAMAYITRIQNAVVAFQVIRVSGTIRGLRY